MASLPMSFASTACDSVLLKGWHWRSPAQTHLKDRSWGIAWTCLDVSTGCGSWNFWIFLIGAKLSRSFQNFFVSTSGQEVNPFRRIVSCVFKCFSCLYYISFPHIPTKSLYPTLFLTLIASPYAGVVRSGLADDTDFLDEVGCQHINQGTQHQCWALPHPDRGHHNFEFCEIKVLCRFQCPLLCGPLRISVTKCSRGSNLITFV